MKNASVDKLVLYGCYASLLFLFFDAVSFFVSESLSFVFFLVLAPLSVLVFTLYLGFSKLKGSWSSLFGQGLLVGFVFSVLIDIFGRFISDWFGIGAIRLDIFYRFTDAFSGNWYPLFDFISSMSLVMVAFGLVIWLGNHVRLLVKK